VEEDNNELGEQVREDMELPVTPEEVIEMADYLGINLKTEYDLLWVARQAVTAPLPSEWLQYLDDNGFPYFYCEGTGKMSRQHPSDRFFLELIKEERQLKWQRLTALQAQGATTGLAPDSTKTPWMGFVTEEGSEYWYNFLTGQTSAEEPPPLEAGQTVNDFGLKKVPQPASYAAGTKATPRSARKTIPHVPELLAFKSWYNERGEKHYMDIIFKPQEGFHIIVQKDIAFDLPEVLGPGGKPLECWDLYVGAKLNVLGKPTILKQADCQTGEWIEKHAKRLKKERDELEGRLRKFSMVAERPRPMNSTSKAKGSVNLRAIMEEIGRVRKKLCEYDPTVLLV